MEPTREDIRFYIYTRYKLGIRARPVHEELTQVYSDRGPSFRTVARWIQHFAGDRVLKTNKGYWETTDVCDRQLCRASRSLNSRKPNYNAQILSLGDWGELRKCTCHRPWTLWSVQEVCKTGLTPADTRAGGVEGDDLSQMAARIWTKWPKEVFWCYGWRVLDFFLYHER